MVMLLIREDVEHSNIFFGLFKTLDGLLEEKSGTFSVWKGKRRRNNVLTEIDWLICYLPRRKKPMEQTGKLQLVDSFALNALNTKDKIRFLGNGLRFLLIEFTVV